MNSKEQETRPVPAPRLRFPGFDGEWQEKPLSFVLHEHKTKSDGKSEVHSVSVHKGVINQIEHLGRSFAATDTSKYSLAKPYDIIYTKSPTGDFPYGVIKQNLTGKNVIVSPLYGVFEPESKYIGFIIHAYFEEAARTNNYLASLIQKGAKNTIQISNDRFISKAFYLPAEQSEQKKIADFLMSLDAVIATHQRKQGALREHKRGLMAGLFPAEGERVPRLRFPEFEGAGEWEEKKLGEVCIRIMDGTHFSPKSQTGPFKYLTSKNIRPGLLDLSSVAYISEEEHKQIYKRCPVIINDILLTKDGANTGNCAINTLNEDFSLLSSVAVIRASDRICVQRFIFQTIQSEAFQKTIIASVSGQAITRITLEKISNMPLKLPSLPEQTRIAAALSSLDDLITAQSEKIVALQTFKRGLMQGLFPAAVSADPSATQQEAAE